MLSCVWLFATPWTTARQVPLSMGFSRQGYWSGLLFPSPGDLPDPAIEPGSPASQADSLPSEPPGKVSPTLWVLIRVGQAWTEEPDRLQSVRSQRVAHNWSDLAQHGTGSGKAAAICSVFYRKYHGVSVYFPSNTDSTGKLTGPCSCVIYYLCWLSWSPRRGCSSLWVHHSFCTVQAHALPKLSPKVELARADVVPLLIIL